MEQQREFQNPFSQERAWMTFQENMAQAKRLREEILQAVEEGTGNERELILKAAETLGRLTDNTILKKVVARSLEARDSA